MYGLMGKMNAHEGQREDLLKHLVNAARELGDVDGCYLYVVSRAIDDDNAIWVTEVWRSAKDHQASLQQEAIQTLIAKARPLIADMTDRREFVPIGGKGLPDQEPE